MEGEESDELLALKAIYEDQLEIQKCDNGKRISTTIYPATAEDETSQYVWLELSFFLPLKYPDLSPDIEFLKSRGLSDDSLEYLRQKMDEFVEERRGECVLFDLLEIAKDSLTVNNIPSGLCSICLSGFGEGDDFLKTDCFHYFHSYCMNGYRIHLETENRQKTGKYNSTTTVPCPICKLPVILNLNVLLEAKLPLSDDGVELDTELLNSHRLKFEKQYQKQLQNGGLIDLQYEQDKFLLSNIQKAYESHVASLSQDGAEDHKKDSFENCKKSNSNLNHAVIRLQEGATEHRRNQNGDNKEGISHDDDLSPLPEDDKKDLKGENTRESSKKNGSSNSRKPAQKYYKNGYRNQMQYRRNRGGAKTNPRTNTSHNNEDSRKHSEGEYRSDSGYGRRPKSLPTHQSKIGAETNGPSIPHSTHKHKHYPQSKAEKYVPPITKANEHVPVSHAGTGIYHGQTSHPTNRPRSAVHPGRCGHQTFGRGHHGNAATRPRSAVEVESKSGQHFFDGEYVDDDFSCRKEHAPSQRNNHYPRLRRKPDNVESGVSSDSDRFPTGNTTNSAVNSRSSRKGHRVEYSSAKHHENPVSPHSKMQVPSQRYNHYPPSQYRKKPDVEGRISSDYFPTGHTTNNSNSDVNSGTYGHRTFGNGRAEHSSDKKHENSTSSHHKMHTPSQRHNHYSRSHSQKKTDYVERKVPPSLLSSNSSK